MARTVFTCTPAATQSSVSFMGIVNQLHTALTEVGFVQTSDTGQLDLMSTPTLAASTMVGYLIYEMDDAYSTTAPIYLRVELWAITTSFKFGVGVQIGRATDGSGTLVGTASPVYNGYGSSSTRPTTSTIYVCRIDGAFVIYFPQASIMTGEMVCPMFVAVERARGMDGSYRDDALFFVRLGSTAPASLSIVQWIYAYKYSDFSYMGNLHPGAIVLPNVFTAGTGVGGGVIPLFFVPFVWVVGVDPWQPTVIAGLPFSDNPGTPFAVDVYGETHEYLSINPGSQTYTISPVYIGTTQQTLASQTFAHLWDA